MTKKELYAAAWAEWEKQYDEYLDAWENEMSKSVRLSIWLQEEHKLIRLRIWQNWQERG